MTDLTTLATPDTPGELASRHAEQFSRSWHTETHRARLRSAWLVGWNGEPDPYRKGNNFTAPYKSAWRSGKRKRHELEAALNGGA